VVLIDCVCGGIKNFIYPMIPLGIIPMFAFTISLYIGCMNTFEMIWRSSILVILAYLAWSSFVTGGLLAGSLLLLCIPIWLFIGLYNLGYF